MELAKGTKINVGVAVTNGDGEMVPLYFDIEYDGDPNSFKNDIMARVLMNGYTKIVKYKEYMEYAMKCIGHTNTFERVLEKIAMMQFAEPRLQAVKQMKNCGECNEKAYLKGYAEKGLELYKYNGRWCVGCGWNEESLSSEYRAMSMWLDGFTRALDFAGLDADL